MIMLRISNSSQAKVTHLGMGNKICKRHACKEHSGHAAYLQITCGVEQQITRLEIPMENIGRMNVLETSEDLVEKVADVVIAEVLGFE